MYSVSLDLLCALSKLSELQREIVVDHVLRGDSLNVIAQRAGLSRARISQVKEVALSKLARDPLVVATRLSLLDVDTGWQRDPRRVTDQGEAA